MKTKLRICVSLAEKNIRWLKKEAKARTKAAGKTVSVSSVVDGILEERRVP